MIVTTTMKVGLREIEKLCLKYHRTQSGEAHQLDGNDIHKDVIQKERPRHSRTLMKSKGN
jgi:hypothetical protein